MQTCARIEYDRIPRQSSGALYAKSENLARTICRAEHFRSRGPVDGLRSRKMHAAGIGVRSPRPHGAEGTIRRPARKKCRPFASNQKERRPRPVEKCTDTNACAPEVFDFPGTGGQTFWSGALDLFFQRAVGGLPTNQVALRSDFSLHFDDIGYSDEPPTLRWKAAESPRLASIFEIVLRMPLSRFTV